MSEGMSEDKSGSFKIEIKQTGDTYQCPPDDTLLRSGLRAGFGIAYECNVGGCGTCKFELVEGEVDTLWEEAAGLNERDRKRGRRLACQSRPLSDCVIKPILGDHFKPAHVPHRFDAELVEINKLTHDLWEFRFRDEEPARFLPGQYAVLDFPGVEGGRAYSMSNLGNDDGIWDFMIKRVPGGSGTAYLFDDLKVGKTLPIDGPYGLAYLRTDIQRDVVCIAGGSGLAPCISIARAFAEAPELQDRQLHFFYGGRGPEDICGETELCALPGFGERIHFHAAISMEELNRDGQWKGYVGFVHDFARDTLTEEQLQNSEFYMAGPPPMVQAVMTMLAADKKVPPDRIHYDSFF